MNRLIIDSAVINDIPINEYYLKNQDIKGLVFIQHGYESNKNRGADYLALNLARLGYMVVSIDAFKHGDRIAEPYITMQDHYRYSEIFNVVEQTSTDIVELYEKRYSSKYASFDLIGVSMGGFIAFLTCLKTSKIRKLVPVISTLNFTKLATNRKNVENIDAYKLEVMKFIDNIKKIDPVTKTDQFQFESLFMLNNLNDPIITYIDNQEYYEKSKFRNIKFQLYNDVHIVNREMQKDILEFITNEKVVI